MFFSLDCGAGAGPDVEPPRAPAAGAAVVGGAAVVVSVVPFDTGAEDGAAVVVAPNRLGAGVEDGAAVVVPKRLDAGAEDDVAVTAPKRLGAEDDVAAVILKGLGVGAEVVPAGMAGVAETLRPMGAALAGATPNVVVVALEVFPIPAKRFCVGADAVDVVAGAEETLVEGARLNAEPAIGAVVEVTGGWAGVGEKLSAGFCVVGVEDAPLPTEENIGLFWVCDCVFMGLANPSGFWPDSPLVAGVGAAAVEVDKLKPEKGLPPEDCRVGP